MLLIKTFNFHPAKTYAGHFYKTIDSSCAAVLLLKQVMHDKTLYSDSAASLLNITLPFTFSIFCILIFGNSYDTYIIIIYFKKGN